MSKQRSAHNAGLPKRWALQHGAYYYRVPVGLESLWDGKKMYRLGSSLPEAYKVWADKIDAPSTIKTIANLLERYSIEVVPKKSPTTRAGNGFAIKRLIAVLGNMPILELTPQHIYKYVDMRTHKVAAHREVEVLSHAYTKAVQWGIIRSHPFKGEVRLEGERPRTRYIEDWEIIECLALPTKRDKGSVRAIQASMRIKLITGMARGDLLRLRPGHDFTDDGIHIQRHKTAHSSGKRTIYEWSDELRAAVQMAIDARPVDISPFLFCNRRGEGYINEETGEAHGWDSMWGRFIDRVLKETKVAERFTEHDLRAKCASDASTLEHARALLSHADSKTTQAVYRRKPERVKPLR